MQMQANTQSWIDTTNLVLGAALFCVPWIVGPGTPSANSNAWIVGGLVAFNAGCALVGFAAWEEWTNTILGLWAAISPWIFGFQGNIDATWTYVVLGLVIAGLSGFQLWILGKDARGVAA